MPIIDIKGLPGLRGWRDLSTEEKQQWLQANPKARNASMYQLERAYETSQFINEFGPDAFRANDISTRRQMMRERAIGNKFNEVYGEDSDFDELNSMTIEGKERALTIGLDTEKEIEEGASNFAESVRTTPKATTGLFSSASPLLARPEVLANPTKIQEQLTEGSALFNTGMKGREKVKKKLLAEDNERKQKKSDGLFKNYKSSMNDAYNRGELSEDSIEATFKSIVNGDKITENLPGIGEVTYEMPGSRYYDAFKDSYWFKDFSLGEKMDVIARFNAIKDTYGVADAVDTTDRNMQKRVADKQGAIRQLGNTLVNISTGAVAYIMQSLMAFDSFSKIGNPEAFANFQNGKDRNGKELPNIWNVKYWDGVDQFGTFDEKEINEARKRGGISEMQLITRPGKEYGVWPTINAGLGMVKFVVPDLLLNGAMGAIGGKAARLAGAKFTPAGLLATDSTRAGAAIAKYVNPALMAFRSGLGISQAYSTQTYDQTKEAANQLIDKQVDADATNYANSVISSDQGKQAINTYVNSQLQKLKAEHPEFGEKELAMYASAIAEQGMAMYETKLKQDYILNKDLWTSDYDADRKEADIQAGAAAATDFLIEQIRMFAAGMTWRNYTFDPSSRRIMQDNFSGLKILNNAKKELSVGNKHWAAVKPALARVWGGFESNYFDDVTVAFGKGFGLGKFNNYLAHKYNPESAADSIDALSNFFVGIDNAAHSAKGALTKFQSFYDGLVGALGTVTQAVPRVKNLVSKDTYKNFRKDSEGNRITLAESFNKLFMNPLLGSYSDAKARERQLTKTVDTINNTLREKKDTIEDIVGLIGANMDVTNLSMSESSVREIKDAKLRQAYTGALWLRKAMNDPILSQHDGVQEAQQTLERLAQGNVTNDDIATFLGRMDNKSVAELPGNEGAQIAKTRLRDNAIQMLNLQRTYNNIREDVLSSPMYTSIISQENGQQALDDIVEQLAFMRIAGNDWTTRLSEMESEISGSNVVNPTRNRTARYGSRKGWERALEVAQNEVDKYQERYDEGKAFYDNAVNNRKNKKLTIEQRREILSPLKLRLENARELLNIAKDNLKQIKAEEVKEDEVLPVLSEAEIMGLNPEERAFMFHRGKDGNFDNFGEYSEEQRKVITNVKNNINMKDTSLWDKIQDVAELDNMIKDNSYAYGLIVENPDAAVQMVNNLKDNRERMVSNRIVMRGWDKFDSKLESITDNDELVQQAKRTNSRYLQRYVDRHPQSSDTLSGIVDVLKINEDANKVIDTLFEDDVDKSNWKGAIFNILNNPEVRSEDTAMQYLEEAVGLQEVTANQDNLDRILGELEDMQHQRNATVIQDRKAAREEAERKRKEKEFNDNGDNFGFNGYKVGDVIYDKKTGSSFTVKGFEKNEDGEYVMKAKSQGNHQTHSYTLDKTNKKFTKESQKQKKETPKSFMDSLLEGEETPAKEQGKAEQQSTEKPKETEVKTPENPAEKPAEKPVETNAETQSEAPAEKSDFTPEGAVVQPTEDEQVAQDVKDSGNPVVAPATSDPYEDKVQPYEVDTGTLPGNIMYAYDLGTLKNVPFKKIQERTLDPSRGETMPQWFDWLKGIGTSSMKLQQIIDYELGRIIQDHPDTKIQFLKINPRKGSSLTNLVVNVIELNDTLKKYHDNEKYGGTISIDGKTYLIVGTSGFKKDTTIQRNRFNKLNSRITNEAKTYFNANTSADYYVSSAYSQVSDMLNGVPVNALESDDKLTYRTITELINDPARNPRGYKSLQDLVFGVLYNSGFVTSKSMEGLKFYPPVNSRVGNTFVLVETANGVWVPLAIRTVDFTQLRDGKLKDDITNLFMDLTSSDLQTRRDAAKKLFGKERGYLLGTDENNILVGNEQYNNVTVISKGNARTFNLANIDRAEFLRVVSETPFTVRTKMSTFTDIDRLEDYDAAGALMTNSALLGTVSQGYNIWDVKEDGTPDIQKDKQVFTKSEPVSQKTFLSTTIGGNIYRMTMADGVNTYYDAQGREIPQTEENKPFITDIHYNILIQTRNLSPIPDKSKSGNYYIIRNTDNPLAIHRDTNGHINVLNPAQSKSVINLDAQRKAEAKRKEAAKKAAEEQRRMIEETPGEKVMGLGVGEDFESQEQAPQEVKSTPVTNAKEVVATNTSTSEREAFDNNKYSLDELRKLSEGTGENVNFATVWRKKYSVIRPEIKRLTGKDVKNLAEAEQALKELGVSPETVKMDTIEDILKNCRK